MKKRIAIIGGYGLVGGKIAQHLVADQEGLDLVLVGRDPEKGNDLAKKLGAHTFKADLADAASIHAAVEGADLVIGAVKDSELLVLSAAIAAKAAFVSITSGANEPGPVFAHVLQAKPVRPVALLPYWMAGPLTWVTLSVAKSLDNVDRVQMAALYDYADPIGPMTIADSESFGEGTALFRKNGIWTRGVAGQVAIRVDQDGAEPFDAQLLDALDVSSVAAATSARNVAFYLGSGDSVGTRNGGSASVDMYVEIDGQKDGRPVRTRTSIVDPLGQANLTALGALIVCERVLGLDAAPVPLGGLWLPETLVDAATAVNRLQKKGVDISTVSL